MLVRSLSASGGVAVRALLGGPLLEAALDRRPMAGTAADALGRALMGTVLLAVAPGDDERIDADDLRQDEQVQVQIRGQGELERIVAISDAQGRVRGTVSNPGSDLRLRDGQPDVARAIGLGSISVIRHRPGVGQPYSGTVPLTSGEIAGDLTLYLAESEQTPSAMGLGVSIAPGGGAVEAAGFLVQQLPDADPTEVSAIERNVRSVPPLSRLARAGITADDLLDLLLEGVGSRERHQEAPVFHCPCTRERAHRSLQLLGREELRAMVREEIQQEVKCEFCGRAYEFGPDELGSVLPDA
ncbi:MAG: Hsp33 family molecular chaperone HslO [Actinomycetota bacterium]|nr:Hsp33 family molecular chaperone HslO [Actinomycetota bacterium]